MKYTIDRKLRTRGEIYSIGSGLMRTLNSRQTRIAALILLIAAIAAAGVIARGLLMPDSTFIISGERKPQAEQTADAGSPEGTGDAPTDTYVQPIWSADVYSAGFKPFVVQVPNPGQFQAPSTGAVTQPVTDTTGGMGGGLPETPDTDCGCVDRAIDKATGAAAETLSPVPGF